MSTKFGVRRNRTVVCKSSSVPKSTPVAVAVVGGGLVARIAAKKIIRFPPVKDSENNLTTRQTGEGQPYIAS